MSRLSLVAETGEAKKNERTADPWMTDLSEPWEGETRTIRRDQ